MRLPTLPEELASVRRRLTRLLADPKISPRRRNSLKSGLYRRIKVLEARMQGRDILYLVRGARPGRPTAREKATAQSLRLLGAAGAAAKAEFEGGRVVGEVR